MVSNLCKVTGSMQDPAQQGKHALVPLVDGVLMDEYRFYLHAS